MDYFYEVIETASRVSLIVRMHAHVSDKLVIQH
jgi:hypothetical protein